MGALRDSFQLLTNKLNEMKEKDLLQDVEDTITACGAYIDKVTALESAITSARFRMESADYRLFITDLDKGRKLAHNSLIVSVKLLNKYCKLAELDTIFKGDIDSRIAVAEFAMEVVNEMFETRRL